MNDENQDPPKENSAEASSSEASVSESSVANSVSSPTMPVAASKEPLKPARAMQIASVVVGTVLICAGIVVGAWWAISALGDDQATNDAPEVAERSDRSHRNDTNRPIVVVVMASDLGLDDPDSGDIESGDMDSSDLDSGDLDPGGLDLSEALGLGDLDLGDLGSLGDLAELLPFLLDLNELGDALGDALGGGLFGTLPDEPMQDEDDEDDEDTPDEWEPT